jgi:hypothetical protein
MPAFRKGPGLLGLLFLACGRGNPDTGIDTNGPEREFACEIGFPDEDGTYVVAPDYGDAELVLGFQGFLFVRLLVRAEENSPSLVEVRMSMEVDGEPPFDSSQPGVEFKEQGDSTQVSEEILLFLPSNNVSQFKGKTARIVMRLDAAVNASRCTTERYVMLADEDPCIHTGSEPLCPGDTGEPE